MRLWLLGGPEIPKSNQEKHKGRFVCREDYYNLLDTVFGNCAALMDKKSTIYVYRIKKDGTQGLSKPCGYCSALIKFVSLKTIIFTTDDYYGIVDVKDIN